MANKIVKIHGCSGAGKTTVIRKLFEQATEANIVSVTPPDWKKPEAYVAGVPGWNTAICVLGSYENTCGGMDSFPSDAGAIIKGIDYYHQHGHVIFEGLLLSTYYGTVGKDSVKYGDDYIYAFLDTPLMTCLGRVVNRRLAAGNNKPFDPTLTTEKYKTIEKLKERLKVLGHRVVTLNHDADPVAQLKVWMEGNS